jgi:hypothetical protein
MNGFDFLSLTTPQLSVLLEQHRGSFEAFLHNRFTDSIPVDAKRGTVDKLPLTQGRMAADMPRVSKVGQKGNTPLGNSKLEQITYNCETFKFGETLGDVEGKNVRRVIPQISSILRDRAGLQVKFDVEADYLTIITGNGSALTNTLIDTTTLASGEGFQDYGSATHDPLGVLKDMKRRTGGTRLILGYDVADALVQSPQVRNSISGTDAGSAGMVTYASLAGLLRQHGFTQVVIGEGEYHDGAKEFDFNQAWMHDGLCYVERPGNIAYMEHESFFYDAFRNDDRRIDVVRAIETSCFRVKYAEASECITNPLVP